MIHPRRCRRLLVLLLVATLPPARALAQSPEDLRRAKESFNAGAVAYAAGDYLAAIQALDAAYSLTPLPAIAFSLAQAARRQYFVGHERQFLDRAIGLYRGYVQQVPTGGRRADALDALSQLEPLAAVTANASGTGRGNMPGASDPPVKESAATVSRTRILITADPPAANIAIDDGPATASPVIREVEPGPHRVTISAAGFFPVERTITAVTGELIPEAISLREQPCSVAVNAPEGAELYVDGAFIRRGDGPALELSLPSGTHRFTVGENGHRVSSQVLDLERGQTRTVEVTLQPTRQRRASVGLLVGSAVGFGTGMTFTALGFRAQGRAEDFLARSSRGNVSSGDLDAYHDDVSARDRYRTLATVTIVSAVALSLTGLFLHELDRPDQQELSRPLGPTERQDIDLRRPGHVRHRVRPLVAPLAMTGGLGALFGGAF